MTVLAALMLLFDGGISPQDTAEHSALIERVKAIPASKVDESQGPESLNVWLTALVGSDAEKEWYVSSCDLKPDYSQPEESWPLCVSFTGRREGSLGVRVHFGLGTFGKPDLSAPRIQWQSFAWWWCTACDSELADKECTIHGIESLHELVAAGEALKSKAPCTKSRPN